MLFFFALIAKLVEPFLDVEEVVDVVARSAIAYNECVVDVGQVGTHCHLVPLVVRVHVRDVLAYRQQRYLVLLEEVPAIEALLKFFGFKFLRESFLREAFIFASLGHGLLLQHCLI